MGNYVKNLWLKIPVAKFAKGKESRTHAELLTSTTLAEEALKRTMSRHGFQCVGSATMTFISEQHGAGDLPGLVNADI